MSSLWENESQPGSGVKASQLSAMLRISRIITLALIQGVVIFAVLVLFINQMQLNGAAGRMTWLSVGFAGLMIVNMMIIPGLVTTAQLQRFSAADLRDRSEQEQCELVYPAFQTQLLVACALAEGAAMFCVVSYLIERNWMSLAAAGVMVMLMAMRFPTRAGVEFWLENRLGEIRRQ